MSRHGKFTFASLIAAGAALTLALTACSGNAEEADGGDSGEAGSDLQTVSLALDWTANTNHIGLFAAEALGYFEEAGVDLELVPYASAPATDLVTSGTADFGITQQSAVQNARTAGLPIKSVYALVQKETGSLVTLSSRDDLQRPADFDGRIFGGFGSPQTSAVVRAIIQNDGGEGDFQDVSLNTAAYDALTGGSIDFTSTIKTWENVRQELDGEPYRVFEYADYGIPGQHTLVYASTDAYLEANPELAKAFIGALQRGYEYAAENPEEAAQLLIDENSDILVGVEELVLASAQLLADDGYLVTEGTPAGFQNEEFWSGFGAFLLENELLSDANGNTLTEAPDWNEYFTNEFLTQ